MRLHNSEKGNPKEIKLIEMASILLMNVMFLSINGKVYKYDLASKQCLFEFKTFANNHMILFDHDDKLLVTDHCHVRLWDFQDNKEDIP